MGRIILIRHTESQKPRSYIGHTDVGLTKTGIVHAKKLSNFLCSRKIAVIFSSDLSRAAQTAQIISSRLDARISFTSNLREINFGKFEGLGFRQILTRFPGAVSCWENPNRKFPGGEGLADLTTRLKIFTKELDSVPLKQNIIVVSHKGPIQLLICLLMGIPLRFRLKMQIDKGSISILERFSSTTTLRLLNYL